MKRHFHIGGTEVKDSSPTQRWDMQKGETWKRRVNQMNGREGEKQVHS